MSHTYCTCTAQTHKSNIFWNRPMKKYTNWFWIVAKILFLSCLSPPNPIHIHTQKQFCNTHMCTYDTYTYTVEANFAYEFLMRCNKCYLLRKWGKVQGNSCASDAHHLRRHLKGHSEVKTQWHSGESRTKFWWDATSAGYWGNGEMGEERAGTGDSS